MGLASPAQPPVSGAMNGTSYRYCTPGRANHPANGTPNRCTRRRNDDGAHAGRAA